MKSTVYDLITDRVMEQLSKGVVPWRRPWGGAEQAPRNLASGHAYRGINVFLLMGGSSPYWMTFNQAKALGGCVRKGERGTPVVFWKWLEKEDEITGKKSRFPMLRYYTVFNLSQVDGIPAKKIPAVVGTRADVDPIAAADAIVEGMPTRPTIRTAGDQACYMPALDVVTMPARERFNSSAAYYATLFHELTHATGHESRVGRVEKWTGFGSESYAREELIAEMGAAFLMGQAGLVDETIENSAAYIANWLERLKDDRKLVVVAAAQAQRAADFILGRSSAAEGTETTATDDQAQPAEMARAA